MDTIVGISTAPGIGGIGIIRISGKNSFILINKIFKPKQDTEKQSYSIKYGHIINPKTGEEIDEVLVSFFKAPASYTTEDVCEINCHGGNIIIQKILELCLENGTRLAEPGEFTKRAFLNGRIDLIKAEAVIDIINSKTENENKSAINQLNGYLSEKINNIKREILELLSNIEVSIDYPEYDTPEINNNKIINILQNNINYLNKLEKSFDTGKIIKDGIKTVIIGRPNVGKSSLLNKLLKEERAIVTSVAGTTRDTIEEYIKIEGIPLKIIDTAGIRDTENEIEQIGINKAKNIAENADLIIAVFDISNELNDEDKKIIKFIKNKNSIIILNKNDLNNKINKNNKEFNFNKNNIIEISTLNENGIEELQNKIIKIFKLNKINLDNSELITNIRHRDLLKKTIINSNEAINTIKNNMPVDIIAINIKNILESLSEITGENVSEEIINEIFSRFCLGK